MDGSDHIRSSFGIGDVLNVNLVSIAFLVLNMSSFLVVIKKEPRSLGEISHCR